MITKKLKKNNYFNEIYDKNLLNFLINNNEIMKCDENNVIETLINSYYNFIDTNYFDDLECPNCKIKGCLKRNTTYQRHLTYLASDNVINTMITITVVKCSHCAKKGDTQKYHAILPWFVLPYHLYSAHDILSACKDYYNKVKIKEILNRLKIQHKLLYDWIKKLSKYLLPSSIILSMINDKTKIINEINNNLEQFLCRFYSNYLHPFFLFKITCVPLCINP